jgi:hypothetical protein
MAAINSAVNSDGQKGPFLGPEGSRTMAIEHLFSRDPPLPLPILMQSSTANGGLGGAMIGRLNEISMPSCKNSRLGRGGVIHDYSAKSAPLVHWRSSHFSSLSWSRPTLKPIQEAFIAIARLNFET